MTALRVVHVTRDFPPRHSGGLSTAVAGLVEAQAHAGIECVVVSFDDYKPKSGGSIKREPERSQTESGIDVIHVAGKEALERAGQLAGNFVASIVHVHHEGLWDFGAEVANFHRGPTVYTAHVLQSEQDRLRGARATQSTQAQRKALTECTAIHVPSEAVATLIRESTIALGERLRVIPLAISEWPGAAKANQRPRFDGPPLLLYVGRFADINGFGQFLEALPPLFAAYPQLSAIAAGGLPGNERGAKRWQKRWQKMAGAHEARLQMPGWRAQSELSELYSKATMLVVPSWFETFGQVVLEGMLHGTPLITTGTGAIAERVDESSAILIEAQDANAIVDGVKNLLSDPAGANVRRAVAYKKAQQGYSWADRIPLFQALYKQLRN